MSKELNFLEVAEQYKKGVISIYDDKIKKIEAIIGEMASTVDGLNELAEVIGIYLKQNFNKFDISPYLFQNRNFKLGDRPEFRTKKKGIKAYWIAPNSYVPKSRNYSEVLTMEFDTISVAPECALDDIKSGRFDSFMELLADSGEAIQNQIGAKIYTLLDQFYNEVKTPDLYTEDTGSLSSSSLDEMIDLVRYKSGKSPTIIGDALLTGQITSFDNFAPEAVEEIRKTGKLGVYRGATILGLPEVKDPSTNQVIVPKNKIFVSSSKIGYSGTYGDPKSGQETNLDDWSWYARIDQSYGACATDVNGLGVIKVV